MPVPHVYGFDKDFADGMMDTLIERWFTVDPAGALTGIQDLEKRFIIGPGERWAGAGEFANALARVRPELLLGALPERAIWDVMEHSVQTAFVTLGARDPKAARTFLDRFADPDHRKNAEVAIASGIAKTDPLAAMALARSLDNAAIFRAALQEAQAKGAGAVRDVLTANARKFPIGFGLDGMVLRFPDENWGSLAGDAPDSSPDLTVEAIQEAARIAPDERRRRLDQIDDLPPNLRTKISNALLGPWIQEDPQEATKWALSRAKPDDLKTSDNEPVRTAFTQWSQTDGAAALAWWTQLPASPLRESLGNSIAASLAFQGKMEEALKLFAPTERSESAGAASSIARVRAERDPVATAAWLDSLPPDFAAPSAVGSLVGVWFTRDPIAVAKWVEAQPAGPRRDAALQAYSGAAAQSDPAAASAWAETISDTETRTKAAEFIYRQISSTDPHEARAWLRGFPGVDENWRERFLRVNFP